jgi:hypothetical protein
MRLRAIKPLQSFLIGVKIFFSKYGVMSGVKKNSSSLVDFEGINLL